MVRIARYQQRRVVATAATLWLFATIQIAAEPFAVVAPHGKTAVYSTVDIADLFPVGGQAETIHAGGIQFNLMYQDEVDGFWDPGYGAAARQCFHNVLAYVANVLDYESGELDIQINRSKFNGTGAVASAGTVFLLYPGIHVGGTLHRLNTGEKLLDYVPEINLTVNFGYRFAMGEEPPAINELDLFSVLLHEMTHGIGFVTRIGPTGQSQGLPWSYSSYDALLTDRSGKPLLALDGLVPVFQADPSVLTNFDVAFNGINAAAQFGDGQPVPVFTSRPFSPGSSLAHWAYGAVVGDVLMERGISPGRMHREYAPEDLGAVIDLRNYSRGDGRAGDGPSGCSALRQTAESQRAGADWIVLGGLLLILHASGQVTGSRLSGIIGKRTDESKNLTNL